MAVGDGDLEAIFDNGDFTDTAEIYGAVGDIGTLPPIATVSGWLTEGTQQASLMTNEIEVINPMFDASTMDMVNVSKGHIAVVNGSTTYSIERKQNNGNGVTTLHLKT